MGKKQYNSAADRRWQQRYQRITERRESCREYESPRKERRRQKQACGWYYGQRPDISKMFDEHVAVVCQSANEIRNLYLAVSEIFPQYTTLWNKETCDSCWFTYGATAAMAIETEDWWFGEETKLKCRTDAYYDSKGYRLIGYDELIPVRDLGNMIQSEMSAFALLGI